VAAAIALLARLGIGPTLASIITWAAIALVVSGAVWGGYELIKNRGADEVRDQIERQNNEAGNKGSEARLSRAECVAAGGLYDFRTGHCTGLAAGNRQ
jgi:uncharacterized membrane protein YjfL (UPF0719 family)